MLVAAIWYNVDQNQPSCPFFLDIDVEDGATKRDVEDWLREYYAKSETYIADGPGEDREVDSIVVDPVDITIGHGGHYGDLQVSHSDDTFLFLSFSEADRLRLGFKKAS